MTTAPVAKANKSWLKLAVIPLLLGVLAVVVWKNQAPSTESSIAPAPAPIAPAILAARATEKTAAPEVKKGKRVAWPKFTTEQILATNPFHGSDAMRAAFNPVPETLSPTAEQAAEAHEDESEVADPWSLLVDSFKEDSIGVYIETSTGPAIKIGSRLLQVGDQIGDRYRITGIRADGILVEAMPALK
jgi:hypothetical protein